jgi:hypothetical protein
MDVSLLEWFVVHFIVPLASIVAFTWLFLRPDRLEDC